MYTLTSIQFFDNNLDELSDLLEEKIQQAPNFFQYAPIIIDVGRLNSDCNTFDFEFLLQNLRSKKLIPIGVRGANKALKEKAITAGLAIFPGDKVISKKHRAAQVAHEPEPLATAAMSIRSEPLSNTPTRIITQPIRSGQQIYVPGGDLIVMAAVSHGAEVLADGHIHVHGPLRGRALAGVMGDREAMIFCKSLEAELVSIAGQYRVCEDLKESCWKQEAYIQLQNNRLNIRTV